LLFLRHSDANGNFQISKEITRLQSIKRTNLKLNRDLEMSKEQIDSLMARKTELENQIEAMQVIRSSISCNI